MRYTVAITAFHFPHHSLWMGFPVAPAAKGNLLVGRVTVSARHRGVFGVFCLEPAVHGVVAACANRRLCVLLVGYQRGFVDRMTRHAVL
jgi:hypothetical protein